MQLGTPTSPYFSPVALDGVFNASRQDLPPELRTPRKFADVQGPRTIRGMPFLFGFTGRPDVVLIADGSVSLTLGGATASYLVFVHVVEDAPEGADVRFTGDRTPSRLGSVVSEYVLEYADGSRHVVPILRGFSIQQARIVGGLGISTSWVCVPAVDDRVVAAVDEALTLGLPSEGAWFYGRESGRTAAGVWAADDEWDPGVLWLGAVRNPRPRDPISAIVCRPVEARSAVYALSVSAVSDHPLRPGRRGKLRLALPDGVDPNAIGEVADSDIAIDLGLVISARPALEYDREHWLTWEKGVVAQPARCEREVIIEYAAHPQAHLHLGGQVYDLARLAHASVDRLPDERPVRLRFVERGKPERIAVRLHMHGEAGEYLPPRGHHRKVNRVWHQDNYAEFVCGENQYAYVDGECTADLPLGTVYIEISRGFEVMPIRTAFEVGAETDEVTFELDHVLRWRERGWVTADTHVHFLSPQTALLEAKAEGVNVVNLLAAQWGELFTNVGDFDGTTTFGADEHDRGEFLVRVGSENRTPALGHISLLGYRGELIDPLSTAGPNEAAYGDLMESTMAEWARRCLDQGGLVVLPHTQWLQLEHAADVVLDLVDAIELMHPNPQDVSAAERFALSPYGLADWYRYQNLGYQLPLTAGSDKMSAAMLLGGIRSYVQLNGRELTYENWIDAVRDGNTFVSAGPLVELTVDGVAPGGRVRLPPGGGVVDVEWLMECLYVPVDAVEVIVGGDCGDREELGGKLSAQGGAAVRVTRSTWIAACVRGSFHGRSDDIVAHTSAVQVLVEGSELFSETDAIALLEQIQGAMAYVDTLAPRPDPQRFSQLRASLETAYDRLHQRMNSAGIRNRQLMPAPGEPHEH